MAAFREALADGADVIETDVRMSADGVLVCLHDPTLDRTTDGSGPVGRHTLESIRRLSASGGNLRYRDEKVPTLAEVAGLIPEDRALAVELKGREFTDEKALRVLLSVLEETGIGRRTLVISFVERQLAILQQLAPTLALGHVSLHHIVPPSGPSFLGPAPHLLRLNPWYVKAAQRRGQLVCPLDPRPDRRLQRYLGLGCDALLTNDPRRTIEALRQLGNRP